MGETDCQRILKLLYVKGGNEDKRASTHYQLSSGPHHLLCDAHGTKHSVPLRNCAKERLRNFAKEPPQSQPAAFCTSLFGAGSHLPQIVPGASRVNEPAVDRPSGMPPCKAYVHRVSSPHLLFTLCSQGTRPHSEYTLHVTCLGATGRGFQKPAPLRTC
eukprot:EG_transcript_29098